VYANEIDIEGLVAGTSVWQRAVVHPETIRAIVEDYGAVRGNLLKHASGWPTAERLLSTIAAGQPAMAWPRSARAAARQARAP
jgi:hypothetical protein